MPSISGAAKEVVNITIESAEGAYSGASLATTICVLAVGSAVTAVSGGAATVPAALSAISRLSYVPYVLTAVGATKPFITRAVGYLWNSSKKPLVVEKPPIDNNFEVLVQDSKNEPNYHDHDQCKSICPKQN